MLLCYYYNYKYYYNYIDYNYYDYYYSKARHACLKACIWDQAFNCDPASIGSFTLYVGSLLVWCKLQADAASDAGGRQSRPQSARHNHHHHPRHHHDIQSQYDRSDQRSPAHANTLSSSSTRQVVVVVVVVVVVDIIMTYSHSTTDQISVHRHRLTLCVHNPLGKFCAL